MPIKSATPNPPENQVVRYQSTEMGRSPSDPDPAAERRRLTTDASANTPPRVELPSPTTPDGKKIADFFDQMHTWNGKSTARAGILFTLGKLTSGAFKTIGGAFSGVGTISNNGDLKGVGDSLVKPTGIPDAGLSVLGAGLAVANCVKSVYETIKAGVDFSNTRENAQKFDQLFEHLKAPNLTKDERAQIYREIRGIDKTVQSHAEAKAKLWAQGKAAPKDALGLIKNSVGLANSGLSIAKEVVEKGSVVAQGVGTASQSLGIAGGGVLVVSGSISTGLSLYGYHKASQKGGKIDLALDKIKDETVKHLAKDKKESFSKIERTKILQHIGEHARDGISSEKKKAVLGGIGGVLGIAGGVGAIAVGVLALAGVTVATGGVAGAVVLGLAVGGGAVGVLSFGTALGLTAYKMSEQSADTDAKDQVATDDKINTILKNSEKMLRDNYDRSHGQGAGETRGIDFAAMAKNQLACENRHYATYLFAEKLAQAFNGMNEGQKEPMLAFLETAGMDAKTLVRLEALLTADNTAKPPEVRAAADIIGKVFY